jgi:hypothetical protein
MTPNDVLANAAVHPFVPSTLSETLLTAALLLLRNVSASKSPAATLEQVTVIVVADAGVPVLQLVTVIAAQAGVLQRKPASSNSLSNLTAPSSG